MMPRRTNRQHPAAQNPAGLRRRIIPVDRRGRRGKTAPLRHQESIGREAQGRMMMKPTPAPALEMAQPQFLLQLFGVTLDDPTVLGQPDQVADFCFCRQSREPIFRRLGFALRPLDEQPFFRTRLSAPFVPMRWTDTKQGKPRTERTFHTLPPQALGRLAPAAPRLFRQRSFPPASKPSWRGSRLARRADPMP